MPEKKNQSQEEDKRQEKSQNFIKEKIVREPVPRRTIIRRLALTVFSAMLFGVVAAVCFVVARPLADRYLGTAATVESSQITIPKDEPETNPAASEAQTTAETQETEPIGDVVRMEMEKYEYTADDLNVLYGAIHTVASQADQGIVTVHAIRHQVDWFDNPVETTGQYAGVLIAETETEALALTSGHAVDTADSLEVVFQDGTVAAATLKQRDTVADLAVLSIDLSQLTEEQLEQLTVVELGNSYAVKQGDLVITIGGTAGIVHSSDYGPVSCIVKNVQTIDGVSRILYTPAGGSPETGTFLVNTSGQLIGWLTDEYDNESNASNMSSAMLISDYKGMLELLSNGLAVPYFGIRGQEVSPAMEESGMPKGIYVTDCISGSPAYEAGIQSGDILVQFGNVRISTMKEFQNQIEKAETGSQVPVLVRRNGTDEYKEIKFEAVIGSR